LGTYIALLRGINVGQKTIKMEHLKALLESMDLRNVRTYIQSGNVVFDSESDNEGELAAKLEKKLQETYSFQVPVIMRTLHEMEEIIRNTPYRSGDLKESESVYVTFLSDIPSKAAIDNAKSAPSGNDEFVVQGREAYILIRDSYGTTKLSNAFLEKKLKVNATTRNWATVNKLADMARE
jgi:uncharacterized protein (DUF1697 family)